MGCFSWLFADTDNTQNLRTDLSLIHILPVYTLHGEKVWNRIGDRVELHLGNGNNVLCSEKVFRKVEPFLEAIPKS